MNQAEQLLNNLYTRANATTDDYILVIDNYTRTINIPSGITNIGVERDDEVLRLEFKTYRYLSGVDLSAFSIRINYVNARGEEDVYMVTDAAVDGEYITFSWLVGPTATAYQGNTKFNVCMVLTDNDSVVQQEYNTTIASLPVLKGLECNERVVSTYTDILGQWENRLFGHDMTVKIESVQTTNDTTTTVTLLAGDFSEAKEKINNGIPVTALVNYEVTDQDANLLVRRNSVCDISINLSNDGEYLYIHNHVGIFVFSDNTCQVDSSNSQH